MAEKRIRCPYCKKVFLWKPSKADSADSPTVSLKCPYCKEQLVIKKEMIR